MLPPSYLDQMPDAFVQLWQQVEEQILQDVAVVALPADRGAA